MAIPQEHWKRLLELLDTCLEMNEPEREVWLRHLEGPDSELVDPLRRLLAQRSLLNEQNFLANPVSLTAVSAAGSSAHTSNPADPGGVLASGSEETVVAPPAPQATPIRPVDGPPLGELPTLKRDSLPAAAGNLLVGRFKLIEEIGRGGMGRVFSARDTMMQGEPLIAIKLLNEAFRKNEAAVTGLERECRRVRMLAHENIVRVFEFYRSEEQVFITMEYLQGETLDKVIKRSPTGMPYEEGWPLIREAAAALAYSHGRSPPFIHYDFKPGNVFLTKEGHVKVLDFGVARAIRSQEQQDPTTQLYETAMPGYLTMGYASCEMLAGLEPDPRDDVYSLSCVAYQILSGVHPFGGVPAVTARDAGLTPQPIAGLTDARNRALAQGLAFARADRTPTLEQFIEQFEGSKPSSSGLRSGGVWVGAVGAAVLIAAGLWASGRLTKAPVPQTNTNVPGSKVAALYRYLGVADASVRANESYARSAVAETVRKSSRHVTLGSSPAQIQAAFDFCRHFASDCSLDMYADERPREATLAPFQLDASAVTVSDFGKFVAATGYRTQAEKAGSAFALDRDVLRRVKGGNWRNAVSTTEPPGESAVVGVSFEDAQQYCAWNHQRLPTEDEWEYAARGPQLNVFPWGDDVTPALGTGSGRPMAVAGPHGGINNLYVGMSGGVWEWVDTQINDRKVLKGGSWLETNPANKRSAARRTDSPDRADSDSGFRCARSISTWPDAQLWLERFL